LIGAALDNLGFMYDEGLGVAEDDAEAVRWFRLAAEQGYAWAQNNLGRMYYSGRAWHRTTSWRTCGLTSRRRSLTKT
jgi:TPR repeat protein